MSNIHGQTRQQLGTMGDAAVDGLLAGALAGAVMAAYLVVAGVAQGEALGTMLARFDPQAASPVVGLFTHLAVASVYGAIFGLGWRVASRVWPQRWVWLAGLVYGLILLGLAQTLLLPASASALRVISPLHFALAHGVYGLALGFGLARRQRKDVPMRSEGE